MSYAEAQYIIDETAGKVEKAAEKLQRKSFFMHQKIRQM